MMMTKKVAKTKLNNIVANLRKAELVKREHRINKIISDAMIEYVRTNGRNLFEGRALYQGECLYGYNQEEYWEPKQDVAYQNLFVLTNQVLNAILPQKLFAGMLNVAKQIGHINKFAEWPTPEWRERIFIVFNNGTLEVEFGKEANQHIWHDEFFPGVYAQYKINCDYDVKFLQEEYWKRSFIGKYFEDFYDEADLIALQTFLSAVLIPAFNPQVALLILGEGGDGKGVLMGALKKLFGITMTELSISKWEGNHDTMIFVGSILNVTSEAPSREISIDIWKSIVANDSMIINPKYEKPFSYKPCCKQILTLNDYPKIALDKAVQRRMLIVKTKKSTSDSERSELFRLDFERNKDALVSFMLTGLHKLYKSEFQLCKGGNQAADEMLYQNESTIVDYYENCIAVTDDKSDFVSNADLFDTYTIWREENAKGAKEFTRSTFSKKLNSLLVMKKHEARNIMKSVEGKSVRGFWGIKTDPQWQSSLDILRQNDINFRKIKLN